MATKDESRPPRVTLGIRVPAAHAEAIKTYAANLAADMGVRVSPSAAGAKVLAAGLMALGLIPAPATLKRSSSPASSSTAKGGKKPARKP